MLSFEKWLDWPLTGCVRWCLAPHCSGHRPSWWPRARRGCRKKRAAQAPSLTVRTRGAGVGVVGVMTGVRVQGAVAVVGQCPIARAGCGVGWHGRSAHAHTCQHCRHAHTWRATVEWSAAVAVAGGVMCAVQCLAVASEPRRHDRGVQRCGACGWAGVAPRAVQWLRRPLHDHRARRSVCPQGTV